MKKKKKKKKEAFQALWIEIQSSQKSNIISVLYIDSIILRELASNKSVYIVADFNINLLLAETSCYAQDFLLSLQSFSFIPTIDKPTHVHNNSSATLIDNVLANKVDANITGGNIVSDISDQYSQFCVSHTFLRRRSRENKSAEIIRFNSELSDALLKPN